MSIAEHRLEQSTSVEADVRTVFALLEDVGRWPQFHLSAVHAEVLSNDERGELVAHWSLDGDSRVRTSRSLRRIDRDAGAIAFELLDIGPPGTAISGEWLVRAVAPGRTEVELRHVVDTARAGASTDTDGTGPLLDQLTRDGKEHLDTLRDTAERRADLDDLVVSFTDPLFIAGAVEDAYDYLYRADLWPERIPHVTGLDMTEDVPNVQFFDMDTRGPDGTTHTVRSVRICRPSNLIVYKQISLPAVLDAHTGHWRFTETREGVIAEARHTSTIKPSALSLLGGGTTVDTARRYLRRLLSGNSMSNLRLAKAFAEERAGFPVDASH